MREFFRTFSFFIRCFLLGHTSHTDPNKNKKWERRQNKLKSISNFSGNISIQDLCDEVKIVPIDQTAEFKLP